MTNEPDARAGWQDPALEPLTDVDATADHAAPIRNALTSVPI